MINRRNFVGAFAGAPLVWSVAAHAQQPAMPVIGFLGSTSADRFDYLVTAFRAGLGEAGYVEGRNVAIEYRWAGGDYDRLPALAAELVGRKVTVILASGGSRPALAAKAATSSIPIVFTGVSDALRVGLVASFNRPGGNVTGVSILTTELETKRLELLRELVPAADVIGVLANPGNPDTSEKLSDLQEAAQRLKLQLAIVKASADADFDPAFNALVQRRAQAVLVAADAFFSSRQEQIVALAARYTRPAIYQWREFALAGGLMSYGTNLPDAYRLAGAYVGRILKGGKPADLPVLQQAKVELIINVKTARELGLEIPQVLLARADEVIE